MGFAQAKPTIPEALKILPEEHQKNLEKYTSARNPTADHTNNDSELRILGVFFQ